MNLRARTSMTVVLCASLMACTQTFRPSDAPELGVTSQDADRSQAIRVLNPSFELPAMPFGQATIGVINGWQATGTAGVYHPGPAQFHLPLPDGVQTAYCNGGTISQTLSETFQSNTTYRLTVSVGWRLDTAFPGYSVALYAGAQILASESSPRPEQGNFATAVVTFTSAEADPREGQPLRIVFSSLGSQINFDRVSLEAIRPAYPGASIWSAHGGIAYGRAFGRSVATDPDGNTIVAGEFYRDLYLGGQCSLVVHSVGAGGNDADIYVAKFSPTGVCQWARGFGDYRDQFGRGVALDADGFIYLVGDFANPGTIDFGSPCEPINSLGENIFLTKLAPDGSCVWSKRFGFTDSQYGRAIAVDRAGANTSVTIAGEFYNRVSFDGATILEARGADVYVAKFAASDGLYQQAYRYGDDADQVATSVAVDADHNILVTGWFNGHLNFNDPEHPEQPDPRYDLASYGQDVFVAKLGPDLQHRWSSVYGDDSRPQIGYGVATDSHSNVILAGAFKGTMSRGLPETLQSASPDQMDVFLIKLDALGRDGHGAAAWARRYGDEREQRGLSVAIGPSDSIFLTGNFQGVLDFHSGPPLINNSAVMEVFVAKFSGDGVCFGSQQYGDTQLDAEGCAVGIDPGGKTLLTGFYGGTTDFGNGPLQASGNIDLFLAEFPHVCDGANCNGCCASDNICFAPSAAHCGARGSYCSTCNGFFADRCQNGQCQCGGNDACATGQQCVGGACVCNGDSCPEGCCGPGGVCTTASVACDLRSDGCYRGQCRCGPNSPCADGQQCVGGTCVCNATSCPNGCCGADGRCHHEDSACGTGGGACSACASGQYCGAGGCRCDASSCPNGCCVGGPTGTCHNNDRTACGQACLICTGEQSACSMGACTCQPGPGICGSYPYCHPCNCWDDAGHQCGAWGFCRTCTCEDLENCDCGPDCCICDRRTGYCSSRRSPITGECSEPL